MPKIARMLSNGHKNVINNNVICITLLYDFDNKITNGKKKFPLPCCVELGGGEHVKFEVHRYKKPLRKGYVKHKSLESVAPQKTRVITK